jgi:hypothetical protein
MLTDAGRAVMGRMRSIGSAHDREITGALSADERATLGQLLAKLAATHDLPENVQPGYRSREGDARER